MVEVARDLPRLTDELRQQGKLDGRSTSALLVVAHAPQRVASRFTGSDYLEQLTRYQVFALRALKSSPNRATYSVTVKAVREGFAEVMDQVADDLLSQAEQHRDQALDGPLDRDYFSNQLFLGTAKASAAMHLYQLLKEAAPKGESGHRPKRRAVAEELAVRMQDGVDRQWLDVGDVQMARDWEEAHRLKEIGDERGLRRFLTEGELRLFRPRAARELLLGPSPWDNPRGKQ